MLKIKFVALCLLPLFAVSCITTYRDFPIAMIGKEPQSKLYDTLYYKINPFPILDVGGQRALHSVFKQKTNFTNTIHVLDMPNEGIYCLVDVKWKTPSLPALVFGYISIAFSTFLPAWSLQDGYVIDYHLFVDGQQKKVFEYEVTRKVSLWIALLPFIWVNLLTYDETEAFEATAYQFLQDANTLFAEAS
jgi:hypothetical protein